MPYSHATPQTSLAFTPAQTSISTILKTAISESLLSSTHPCAIFYDLPTLRSTIKSLEEAFPTPIRHAFAVKAAPLPGLLRHIREAGMYGEAASIGEVALCNAAGLVGSQVVFDSPAKTEPHLIKALQDRVHLNADSFEEVEKIAELRQAHGLEGGVIGLRINPQLNQQATITATFTASKSNKFGEPLQERREDIIQLYKKYQWLDGLHMHAGSQGCSLDLIVAAIKETVAMADEINEKGGSIKVLDIGGGLSVDYDSDGMGASFQDLADLLDKHVPGLKKYNIVTEFGRRICSSSGFIAARVQNVKQSGGKNYVICHVGADCLVRPVYVPEKWHHRVEIYDKDGKLKTGEEFIADVGGPLCFSGDIIARDRKVVRPEEGDILVVRDAGAYTLALYNRHTSQLTPGVYGWDGNGRLETLKKQETLEDLVRFWS